MNKQGEGIIFCLLVLIISLYLNNSAGLTSDWGLCVKFTCFTCSHVFLPTVLKKTYLYGVNKLDHHYDLSNLVVFFLKKQWFLFKIYIRRRLYSVLQFYLLFFLKLQTEFEEHYLSDKYINIIAN